MTLDAAQAVAPEGFTTTNQLDDIDARFLECVAESRGMTWYWPDCSQQQMLLPLALMQSLGYAPGELGSNMATYSSLVHPDERVLLRRAMTTALSEGFVGNFASDYRMRRKDGGYVWVRDFMVIVRRPGSGISSSYGVTRLLDADTSTIRPSLNFTHDALHTALNELGHPVMLLTEDGAIVQANEASARVAGRSTESLVGTRDCPFLRAADGSSIAPGFLAYVACTGQRGVRELQRFDRWWQIHLVPVGHTEYQLGRVLLLAQDITALKAAQARELASEKSRTLNRVREVHHRVKNHLQGLIGLLRADSDSQHPRGAVIDTAVARILSIATVHGLLAEDGRTSIEFLDLCEQIIAAQRLASPVPLRFTPNRAQWHLVALSQEETVPLAVAISELVTNAIKHTATTPAGYVEATLLHSGGEIEFHISNGPARLPPGFSVSGGVGPQAGLALVQALLSRNHSRLEVFQNGEHVTTCLRIRLQPPGALPH